jgi:type II secretory pathway pseudopilin PulG
MLRNAERSEICDETGASLVELLVVLVLLGIIGGMVTSAVTTAFRSTATTQARIDALQELEVALQRMTRDFRTASELQLAPIGDASASFDDYLGADIIRGGTLEPIRYRLVDPGNGDPQRLIRVDTGQTLVTLVDNGGEPVFSYLRFDGSEIDCDGLSEAQCGDAILEGVTTVGIRLVREIDGRAPVAAETRVAVRSIRYGS